MEIVETPIFTQTIQKMIGEDSYQKLQNTLIDTPEAGKIIKGSGGIRKIRWLLQGRGKRGGIRVLYYYYTSQSQIFMLYAYAKNQQRDLTQKQLKALKRVLEKE